jgi:hypothetical protein
MSVLGEATKTPWARGNRAAWYTAPAVHEGLSRLTGLVE